MEGEKYMNKNLRSKQLIIFFQFRSTNKASPGDREQQLRNVVSSSGSSEYHVSLNLSLKA